MRDCPIGIGLALLKPVAIVLEVVFEVLVDTLIEVVVALVTVVAGDFEHPAKIMDTAIKTKTTIFMISSFSHLPGCPFGLIP